MNTLSLLRLLSFAVIAALVLAGCESCGERCLGHNRFNPDEVVVLNADLAREFHAPLYCENESECQLMLQRGAEFLRQNATFGINVQTNTMLETHIPHGSWVLSYRITLEPRDNGRYQVMAGVACTLSGPCQQDKREMAARAKHFMRTGYNYDPMRAATAQPTPAALHPPTSGSVPAMPGSSGAQTTPVVGQPQAIPTPLNLPTGEVILYRDKRALNAEVDYFVHWQGKPQGVIRNGGALRVRLPAGPQVLIISYRPGAPEFQERLIVSEGSEDYLFMRLNYSLSARSHLTIEPVPLEQGRAAVMALQK